MAANPFRQRARPLPIRRAGPEPARKAARDRRKAENPLPNGQFALTGAGRFCYETAHNRDDVS
jgi:hypothetical protein